jgi:signal transduction histidine kinase
MKEMKLRNVEELRAAIRDLEHQNYVNEQQMRKRVYAIRDKLKPMNIVKNLFSQVIGTSEVKTNIFRLIAGMATSFIVKKFFKKGIASK